MNDQLQGLHSLETLLLSCEHLEAVLPELCLRELVRLRHVRLDDVIPEKLSLPPSCRMDLKGEASVMDEVQFCVPDSSALMPVPFLHVHSRSGPLRHSLSHTNALLESGGPYYFISCRYFRVCQ